MKYKYVRIHSKRPMSKSILVSKMSFWVKTYVTIWQFVQISRGKTGNLITENHHCISFFSKNLKKKQKNGQYRSKLSSKRARKS